MQLQEALDELRGSILRDVSSLKTGPPDQYWTDDALVLYIDEAQRRFARRSFCLRDSTTPQVTQVVLSSKVGGTPVNTYSLDPSVIFVVSARHQDDAWDMMRTSHTIPFDATNVFIDWFDFSNQVNPSHPVAFSTDEGIDLDSDHAIMLRVFPDPDTDEDGKIINLRTVRVPLNALSVDALDQDLEIPIDYQLDMLEWAAWRALRNWDIDAEDRKKAESHKARFEDAVREARKEARRKIFQQITWQFGRNGFSYSRRI